MIEFQSVEQLKAAVGSTLGRSRVHRIDQTQVDAFASLSGDFQWIHVDTERAALGPYGHTVGHGLLTVSISQHLAHEMWDLSIKKTGLLYGFNKMRFPAPLLIPADISVDVTLLSVDATDQFCRVTSTVTTWAEDTVKPVCVTEPVILYTL
jgi:acyl dehydratase